MDALPSLLALLHVLGLVLAVGCATAKTALLFKCTSDQAFLPVFVAASRPLTRLLISGLVLLTLSGTGWLFIGYDLRPILIVKLCFVAAIWVLGPVIDNVVEPKFKKLMPVLGEPASAEFLAIQKQYVALEGVATGLFYVIIVIWMLL
jgi:hypothetical protein